MSVALDARSAPAPLLGRRVTTALAWAAQQRDALAIGIALVVGVLAFKHAHAQAGADELAFVLAPSCWLVHHLGGVALTHEAGAGYIAHSPRMIVGPACSGLTFLAVAWLAFYFHLQGTLRGPLRKLAWVCASALLAYAVTIATNATRIVLAAALYDADFYAGLITKARLHRVLGVVLYCVTLLGGCRLLDRCARATALRLPPLAWYLGVVLGVPWLHYARGGAPALLREHAAITLLTTLAVAACVWSAQHAARALSGRRLREPDRLP